MSITVMKQALEFIDANADGADERDIANALHQAIAEIEKQEPVAWMDADGSISDNNDYGFFPIPLYTTPQRQPLTDEEIRKAKHHMVDGAYQYSFMQGVRYAEAAHGIK